MKIETRNPILPPLGNQDFEQRRIVVVQNLPLADFYGDVAVTVRFWRQSLTSNFAAMRLAKEHRFNKIRKLIDDLSNIQVRCAKERDFFFFFQWADHNGQQVTWANCFYDYSDQGIRNRAVVELGECVHPSFRREARL